MYTNSPSLGEHGDGPGLVQVGANDGFAASSVETRDLHHSPAIVGPVDVVSHPVHSKSIRGGEVGVDDVLCAREIQHVYRSVHVKLYELRFSTRNC